MEKVIKHKKLFALVTIIVLLLLSVFAFFYIDRHYLFLTKNSRTRIEEMFGISLTDDIELKRYKKRIVIEGAETSHELEFEFSGGNVLVFIKNNCKGDVRIYDADDSSKVYCLYHYDDKEVVANFYKDGDKYRVRMQFFVEGF